MNDLLTHSSWLAPLIFSVIGACVGSFINLYSWRWPQLTEREWLEDIKAWFQEKHWLFPEQAQSILDQPRLGLALPGSLCPHCRTPIRFYHNLPLIGWLALRGKAHCCGGPISIRYPLVEALGALLGFLAYSAHGATPYAALLAIVLWVLLASSMVDLAVFLLPDRLTYFILFSGLGASLFGISSLEPRQSFLGILVGYSSLELLRIGARLLLRKEAMGQGDPKLLAALGAFLGPTLLIPVLLIASIFGLLGGLAIQRSRGQAASAPIPFGPFLALGGAAMLLFEPWILHLLGWR